MLLPRGESAAQGSRRGNAAHHIRRETESGKEAVCLAALCRYRAGDLFGTEPVGIRHDRADQCARGSASSGRTGNEDLFDGNTGRVDQEAHRSAAEHDVTDRPVVHDGEKGPDILAGELSRDACLGGDPCLGGDLCGRVAAGLEMGSGAQGCEVSLELRGHRANGDLRT